MWQYQDGKLGDECEVAPEYICPYKKRCKGYGASLIIVDLRNPRQLWSYAHQLGKGCKIWAAGQSLYICEPTDESSSDTFAEIEERKSKNRMKKIIRNHLASVRSKLDDIVDDLSGASNE